MVSNDRRDIGKISTLEPCCVLQRQLATTVHKMPGETPSVWTTTMFLEAEGETRLKSHQDHTAKRGSHFNMSLRIDTNVEGDGNTSSRCCKRHGVEQTLEVACVERVSSSLTSRRSTHEAQHVKFPGTFAKLMGLRHFNFFGASHFWKLGTPETLTQWDPPPVCPLCVRGAQRRSGAKRSPCWWPGQHVLLVEAQDTKCGSYAGQLSAVVGVVPLHARTRKVWEVAQDSRSVRRTLQ